MQRFLILAVAAVVLAGCAPGAVEGFIASRYAGTYKGTWTNTTTGATGPGAIAVALNAGKRTLTLTVDFDGNYLGLNDPPPITMIGTYDTKGAVLKGDDPIMGAYDVTIDRNGKIVGLLRFLPGGSVPEMRYTGRLTGDKIETDYTVTLADGKVAESIFRAQKVK